uniref:LIM zinc-binding domain-containing protein n=1 Tax=Strigamia maritima TaxID=126957 RepID=T1JBG5_STRMM
MEKMEANNQRFHKSCFKCWQCSSPLRLDNYTVSDGTFYCTPHFKQLFISKGNYDEGFGREQHKEKWNRSRSTTPNRSRSNTPTTMGTSEYGEVTTEEIYA